MKKRILLTVVCIIFALATGCGQQKQDAIRQEDITNISSQKTYEKDVNSSVTAPQKTDIEESKTLSYTITAENKALFDFAENINNKKYDEAVESLGTSLKRSYSGTDNKALKNIIHMKIVTLIDKTDKSNSSIWYVNPREVGDIYKYKVYYAQIEYELNAIQTYSDLKNGINHIKVIMAKENPDSPWLIGEMSGAFADWKDK